MVDHLLRHLKVGGLKPATTAHTRREKMAKNVETESLKFSGHREPKESFDSFKMLRDLISFRYIAAHAYRQVLLSFSKL